MVATGQAIYMLGFLVGCLVFGAISDHLGRKTAFVATLTLMAVSGTATTFAPNYTTFAILRFITGTTSAGMNNCLFIYSVENIGRNYRTRVAIGQGVCYSMGNLGVAFVAWLLPGWRNIQLGVSAWVFLLFGFFFIIPESPRWLYAEGRLEECEEALRQVAITNKKSYPEKAKLVLNVKQEHTMINSEGTERQPNMRDIMRTPNMRRKTLVLMYEWFMVSFVYYGLSLNAVNLGSNPYLAYSLQALVELPAKVFGAWIIKHWGRRLSLCFTMVTGGFFCLMTLLPFPADKKWIILTISTIGKFCIGATFNLIYLYSGEIYPTVVRNIGLGSNSTCARVSAILAPYVNMLYIYGAWIPQLIFGTTAMSAGFLALMLPETRNSILPETIEEGEAFGRNQKFWTLLPPKDVSQA